jgi:hypothetical protein
VNLRLTKIEPVCIALANGIRDIKDSGLCFESHAQASAQKSAVFIRFRPGIF